MEDVFRKLRCDAPIIHYQQIRGQVQLVPVGREKWQTPF